jgi:hypothetical protein
MARNEPLRRAKTGAFCQKWRDNLRKSLAGPAAAAEPIRWAAKSLPGAPVIAQDTNEHKATH